MHVCTNHLLCALKEYEVIIVPGFTGTSLTGNTVTLGRGGSDYSAFLIARALEVSFVSIYTDVGGVYDKDPKKAEDARIYNVMCCDELLRLIEKGQELCRKKVCFLLEKISFLLK